jgi:threonine synthase
LLDPAAETVVINSGDGLKTLDAVGSPGNGLPTIQPSLAAFEAHEATLAGAA